MNRDEAPSATQREANSMPRYGRRGTSSTLVRFAAVGFGLATTVIVARRLDTAQFGSFMLALLAVFIGGVITSAGAGRVGLKHVTGLITDGQSAEASALTRSVLHVLWVSGPVGFLVAALACAALTDRSTLPLGACASVGFAAGGAEQGVARDLDE